MPKSFGVICAWCSKKNYRLCLNNICYIHDKIMENKLFFMAVND